MNSDLGPVGTRPDAGNATAALIPSLDKNENNMVFKNPLTTTEILLVAIGTCILITTIVVVGVLVVWKCRKKDLFRCGKNGDRDAANGTLRQPLVYSNNYPKPEIIITEPMSDDLGSGRYSMQLEVHSSKSVTHIPACALAVLEDLDENELISPAAITENNISASQPPGYYAKRRNEPIINSGSAAQMAGSGSHPTEIALLQSIESETPTTTDEWEDVRSAAAAVSGRTQSVSSASSDKMDHPSYTYSLQSPHGMQPYGICDPVVVFGAVSVVEDDHLKHSSQSQTVGTAEHRPL